LERYAHELNLSDFVEITGYLSRIQAYARIRGADMAISPIFPTPMFDVASPTKIVEYLALALPVIANVHPEHRRILRASRAGLCPPWSARQFARSVRWLTALNPSQRRDLGQRGRQWVLRHRSYARLADVLEARYLELLAD
jgi:glycosyltransferase involved in cell wall biosynthesis